jgi:ribosomal protein L35
MKLKTVKTAQKRIANITGTGKALRLRMSAQHLAPGKSKRALKGTKIFAHISRADIKRIKRMLPYAKIK